MVGNKEAVVTFPICTTDHKVSNELGGPPFESEAKSLSCSGLQLLSGDLDPLQAH